MDKPPRSWRDFFRALELRNYRFFFLGQGFSLIGTWMQQIAEVWLVYRLTHSAFYLGLVGFVSQIPGFILAPFAGVWVDAVDRRKLLIWTQVAAMLQAFIMAYLVMSDKITVPQIIVLSIIGGIIDAVDIPARQSFVIVMVEKREYLPNAIALNSSLMNSARLIGPSIAGFIIAAAGEGWCFIINGLSYVTIIAALWAMKLTPHTARLNKKSLWGTLREGFFYVANFSPIWTSLGLLAMISLLGTPYSTLMPIFATQVLKGGPHTLGFLMAAAGLGAFTAAIRMAGRRTVLGLGRLIPLGMGGFALCLILFSFSHWFWLSCLILWGGGFCMMTGIASTNTLIQTIVDEDKRGRVMSFFTMAFFGTAPLGSLLAGSLASHFGAPLTIRFGGALCFVSAFIYATQLPRMRLKIRPIYQRMGIIPADQILAGNSLSKIQ
jgi:MFS family permease